MKSTLGLFTITCLLAFSALSLSAPAPSTGQVFTIKAKHVKIPKELADKIHKARSEEDFLHDSLIQKQIETQQRLMKMNDDSAGGQAMFNLTDWYQRAMVGNISIGTPAQNFSVWFNLYSNDLTVMDTTAIFNNASCPVYDDSYSNWMGSDESCSDEVVYVADKTKYNSSASSTYSATNSKAGSFRGSDYYDQGTAVVDTVNIGGLITTMTFGSLKKVSMDLADFPVDGCLGLSPGASPNNIPNVLKQIVGSLAQPVVTIHVNRSYYGWDSDTEIMFGSRALPQCNQTNWQNISLMPSGKYVYGELRQQFATANLTSISIAGPGVAGDCNNVVTATHRLRVVDDYQWETSVSVQALEVFKKASGATYNMKVGRYTIDNSQIANALNVNLNLADGSTIVMTPQDYMYYSPWSQVWVLNVVGTYDDGLYYNRYFSIRLGQAWNNRHCFSYDINANTLSYTDALPNNNGN